MTRENVCRELICTCVTKWSRYVKNHELIHMWHDAVIRVARHVTRMNESFQHAHERVLSHTHKHNLYYDALSHSYFRTHICHEWTSPSTHMQTQHVLSNGVAPTSGSFKSYVSFPEYNLFYRALLQKRPKMLRSLLIIATTHKHNFYHRSALQGGEDA